MAGSQWFRGFQKLPKKRLCASCVLSLARVGVLIQSAVADSCPLVVFSLPSSGFCKHEGRATTPVPRGSSRCLPSLLRRRCLFSRECQRRQQVVPLEAFLPGQTEWLLGTRPSSQRAHLQSSYKAQVRRGGGPEELWV